MAAQTPLTTAATWLNWIIVRTTVSDESRFTAYRVTLADAHTLSDDTASAILVTGQHISF